MQISSARCVVTRGQLIYSEEKTEMISVVVWTVRYSWRPDSSNNWVWLFHICGPVAVAKLLLLRGMTRGLSSSSSSLLTNFIATQVLQKLQGRYVSRVSLVSMVLLPVVCVAVWFNGTVPSSVHAWMPPVTTVTWYFIMLCLCYSCTL